ncbi:MAG TPA: NAD(P)-dependent oxidoreductase [Bacteroidota bacterium]|nr:NAD(P)-dependent oxidoreductase [Bacteroidota bacterium]
MDKSIGFVGLGMMGERMAERLLNAGFSLTIYNRTKEKAEALIRKGGRWSDSPADVASRSQVVFSMISNSEALKQIAEGDRGILHALPAGGVHVDMSTVSPETTKSLGDIYASKGLSFMHSPVLGSTPQAADGSLLLFVGGEESAFKKVEPLLKILGSRIWRFTRPEEASHTKLLCNFFIASMGTTLAQALVYAAKAGVDREKFLDILDHSSLNAPMYQTKGNSMLDRNFAPRFFVEHMLKDVNLVQESGKVLDVPMPAAQVARELFAETVRKGFGREDYSAVVKVIEEKAGVEARRGH